MLSTRTAHAYKGRRVAHRRHVPDRSALGGTQRRPAFEPLVRALCWFFHDENRKRQRDETGWRRSRERVSVCSTISYGANCAFVHIPDLRNSVLSHLIEQERRGACRRIDADAARIDVTFVHMMIDRLSTQHKTTIVSLVPESLRRVVASTRVDEKHVSPTAAAAPFASDGRFLLNAVRSDCLAALCLCVCLSKSFVSILLMFAPSSPV